MKTKLYSVCCLFCLLPIANCLLAQPYDPSKINKKAVDLYQKAILTAESGKYDEAIGLFNQSLVIEPKYIHAHLALGSIYGQLKNYKSSAEAYEKAFAIDSVYTMPDRLLYSVSLAWQGKFEAALAAVNSMLRQEKLSRWKRECLRR